VPPDPSQEGRFMNEIADIKYPLPKPIINLPIRDQFRSFSILVGVFVFLVILIRSIVVGITYDEADSYMRYVRYVKGFDGFLIIDIANNHPLNTFLIYLTTSITQVQFNEFIIRLPNVSAFFIYLLLAYKISATQKYRYFTFSALALNPLLNEFFGLARGYGLAATLTLAALMVYISNRDNPKNIIIATYLFTLSSASIASGLVLLAGFSIFVAFYDLGIKNLPQFIRKNIIHIIILLSINTYLAYAFIKAASNDPNLVGDYTGNLFHAVPFSFAGMFLTIEPFQMALAVIGSLFFIISIVTHIKNLRVIPFSMLLALYIVIAYGIAASMAKPLPSGRVLLPIYPLLALSSIELITQICEINKKYLSPKLVPTFLGIVSFMLVLNFAKSINFTYVSGWSENYRIPHLVYKAMVEHTAMPNVGNPAEEFYINQIELHIKQAKQYLRDHTP
jgi:hypothetical protein